MPKHLKPGTRCERAATFDRAAADDEARTVELAFSSEQPYERGLDRRQGRWKVVSLG